MINATASGGGGPPVPVPIINTFTNNIGVVEMGTTITPTLLGWTLSGGTPTSQIIDQGIGSVQVGTLGAVDVASYQSDRTYNLNVSNPSGNAARSTTVAFQFKRYWGVSSNLVMSSSDILALNAEFATSRLQTKTFNNANGQYMYFAFPAYFGVPSFFENGFPSLGWPGTNQVFVNASGFSTNYFVYHSVNPVFTPPNFTIQVQ